MLRSNRALAACLLALLMPAAPAAAWAPATDGDTPAGTAPVAAWTPPWDAGTDPAYPQQPAPPGPAEWFPTAPPAETSPSQAWGPVEPVLPTTTQKTVAGRTAMLRTDGLAAIPRRAPKRVRAVIAAANRIIGKPYKWGGGHRRLIDSAYDCSGAVSYALIRSGQQRGAMVSGQLAHAYAAGVGRFVSIYAHSKHVYMEVAGLRLDTSPYGDVLRQAGVRWRPVVGQRSGFAVRHLRGL